MPPAVRGSIVRDAVGATGQAGILDIVRFQLLREEDSRRWSGNEFYREVVSNDPQKLVLVESPRLRARP